MEGVFGHAIEDGQGLNGEDCPVRIIDLARRLDETLGAPMVGFLMHTRLQEEEDELIQLQHGLPVPPEAAGIDAPLPVDTGDAHALALRRALGRGQEWEEERGLLAPRADKGRILERSLIAALEPCQLDTAQAAVIHANLLLKRARLFIATKKGDGQRRV
jgi:hypothetical protein